MANTYSLFGVLLSGTHASRPAANAVATGTIYAETDTGVFYQSDGSSWNAWGPTVLTSPMTTKGDIIIADTGGAAIRLAVGTNGQVLTADSGSTGGIHWAAGGGGGGISSGTSFPGSPSTNDLYFRTDIGLIFYYDGTRWLSIELFTIDFSNNSNATSATTDFGYSTPTYPNASDLYIVDMTVTYDVAGTHNSSNYWSFQLSKYNNSATTTIQNIDTDKATSNAYVNPAGTSVNALVGSTKVLFLHLVKTSGPAQITFGCRVRYRVVAT